MKFWHWFGSNRHVPDMPPLDDGLGDDEAEDREREFLATRQRGDQNAARLSALEKRVRTELEFEQSLIRHTRPRIPTHGTRESD